jgi:hypothetical protein
MTNQQKKSHTTHSTQPTCFHHHTQDEYNLTKRIAANLTSKSKFNFFLTLNVMAISSSTTFKTTPTPHPPPKKKKVKKKKKEERKNHIIILYSLMYDYHDVFKSV